MIDKKIDDKKMNSIRASYFFVTNFFVKEEGVPQCP